MFADAVRGLPDMISELESVLLHRVCHRVLFVCVCGLDSGCIGRGRLRAHNMQSRCLTHSSRPSLLRGAASRSSMRVRAVAAPAAAPAKASSGTSTIKFMKYQGLGNDFILVGATAKLQQVTHDGQGARAHSAWGSQVDNRSSPEPIITPEQAAKMCDRHFGIGGDGVRMGHCPRHADSSSFSQRQPTRKFSSTGYRPLSSTAACQCCSRGMHAPVALTTAVLQWSAAAAVLACNVQTQWLCSRLWPWGCLIPAHYGHGRAVAWLNRNHSADKQPEPDLPIGRSISHQAPLCLPHPLTPDTPARSFLRCPPWVTQT